MAFFGFRSWRKGWRLQRVNSWPRDLEHCGSEQSKLGAIEERKAEFAVLITSLRVSHEIIPQDRFAVRL
jgi:hypothetical protein